jgi:hypothetical protein
LIGWVDPRADLDDVEKILHSTGTRTPTPRSFQPVASRYTDYVIPAPFVTCRLENPYLISRAAVNGWGFFLFLLDAALGPPLRPQYTHIDLVSEVSFCLTIYIGCAFWYLRV